jgi:hypothetical protein
LAERTVASTGWGGAGSGRVVMRREKRAFVDGDGNFGTAGCGGARP